ncbi:MAG: glycosyltransferase family 4 protein [Vulcanimicrobiaceae bacterium]
MRIALVTPWYGADLIGGAERLTWDLSHALVRAGNEVDVLTTCCRSFHDDWSANYHRPGASSDDGVTVRRFKVDARDRVAFSRANSALLSLRRDELRRDRPPLPPEKTDAFVFENIRSRALLRYLQESNTRCDAFIFAPYLYGPTLQGLPLVAERAFLLPCLHDEAYAYLDAVRDIIRRARGLLFNSEGELNVAASLYGPWVHFRSAIIGHAIDAVPAPKEAIAIRGFVPQRSRYLLFLGRGDRTKNIDLALDAFQRFRALRRTTSMQLVIAGPHATPLRGDGVVDLGAVTEEEKSALLQSARALVQPSTNESFSRTVYEAWNFRRPVVVHADCTATSEIVHDSRGGWTARAADDWATVFATIDESADAEIDSIGVRGRAAALQIGTWDDVAERSVRAINELLARRHGPSIVPLEEWPGPRAHQPRYDDGKFNVLSLAPLSLTEVERIAEIIGLFRRKVGAARFFVFEEDCPLSTRDRLVAVLATMGLSEVLVVLGADARSRFAALRDAHVACAFGAPLERPDHVVEAMWFDIPVVAFGDRITYELVQPAGVICDRDAPEAAAILAIAAVDNAIRRKVVAQARHERAGQAKIVSTNPIS